MGQKLIHIKIYKTFLTQPNPNLWSVGFQPILTALCFNCVLDYFFIIIVHFLIFNDKIMSLNDNLNSKIT